MFVKNWPPGCPPDEAVWADGVYYRLVKSNPAQDADFRTCEESGKKPHAPPCKRKALSLLATVNDARAYMRRYPKLGSFIAEVHLSSEHGKVLDAHDGHVSWWPCDAVDAGGRVAQVKRVF